MLTKDNFARSLKRLTRLPETGDALTALATRYSYVFPDEAALAVLHSLGPLVEIGAGTGYWAHRLREMNTDILAFDQSPPVSPAVNRYHPSAGTWTEVLSGDQAVLAAYPGRALFVCWPPLFSSLANCLDFYTGDTVAWIGDAGARTARPLGLEPTFGQVSAHPVQALEPGPGTQPTLRVWRRLPTAEAVARRDEV
ncbi:MAG: hypothetical protein WBA31_09490 [Candidatus Dormiibacterota bacterium]